MAFLILTNGSINTVTTLPLNNLKLAFNQKILSWTVYINSLNQVGMDGLIPANKCLKKAA
jgi:hypothetical protein